MPRRAGNAYDGDMHNIIPAPETGHYLLVVTPYINGEIIFDLVARLSLSGELEVLDGGNTFNAYQAMNALRRLGPFQAMRNTLVTTRLARAFTCYQVVTLLEEISSAPAARPLLVLDLLNTFGDESLPVRERRRLLNLSLALLQRLARTRPVGIWVRRRTIAPAETLDFLSQVERTTGRRWRLQAPQPSPPAQRSIF